MPFDISVLNLLLLLSGLFVPLLFASLGKLNGMQIEINLRCVLKYWLYFIISIMCLRLVAGFILTLSGSELFGVAKFYPIRIAYPNYDVLKGLPYLLLCLAALWRLDRIHDFILGSRWKYVVVWAGAVCLLLLFGGIHGGFTAGNIGISNSVEHVADASLNATVRDVFLTHTDRVNGLLKPSYVAPHSTSHPAASIAYWQILTKSVTPLVFSIINVLLFALAFPVIFWALRRRYDDSLAIQGTMVCLLIPAMLIYGRSDDAVYYMFAIVVVAIISVALYESRYSLTLLASGFTFLALNYSYAAVVLLPAALSFSTNTTLSRLWGYVRQVCPHALILIGAVLLALLVEFWATGYEWLRAFQASVHYNHGSTIVPMIVGGEFARVFNDRIMAIYDFIIFSGPLFMYLFIELIRQRSKRIGEWQIRNVALVVLLCLLAINSNGPGEVSRPWGSLFMIIGFFWLTGMISQKIKSIRWSLLRTQFAWSLLLQTPINYGW